MASTKSNALLILFPCFNTLDANGPLEVFRKSGTSEVFNVTIASETDLTTSVEGAIMKRHKPLDKDLIASLSDYDLLIVPGGPSKDSNSPVQKQAKDLSGLFMTLINQFAHLPRSAGEFPRILLSICTGAIFLANLGIFDGRYCTTHWAAYTTVTKYNKEAATRTRGKAGIVLPARFVDSGVNESQVRIISSGGISCGIDASLHVVTLRTKKDAAKEDGAKKDEALDTAVLLDYAWRKTEGVVFGESFDG